MAKDKDIVAFGISDYCSIDGCIRLKEFQEGGRLKDILILPNIELRLSIKTERDHPINLHLIFSNTVPYNRVNSLFEKLSFIVGKRSYSCTRKELTELGKSLNPRLSNEEAYREGVNNFKVDLNKLVSLLDTEFADLTHKYLIGIPNSNSDGASGIQEDNFKAVRQELYSKCYFIFSGNPKDRVYFLGRGVDSEETVIKKYGNLKPCLHGSDAHKLDKIGFPEYDRYCWIKAEPTFHGLLQVLYEPESRVYIGKDKPNPIDPSKIIRSIRINDSKKWFPESPIFFNEGLNCIIGPRGSGKTALMDLIASATYCYRPQSVPNIDRSSFIEKAFTHIEGAEVVISWMDGKEQTVPLSLVESLELEQAVYLSQHGIETLCSLEKTKDLLKIIQKVIFEYIPLSDRMQAIDFDALKDIKIKQIEQKREEINDEMVNLNISIFEIQQDLNSYSDKSQKFRSTSESIKSYEQEIANEKSRLAGNAILKVKEDLIRNDEETEKINGEIAKIKLQQSVLEEIKSKADKLNEAIKEFNRENRDLLQEMNLQDLAGSLDFKTNEEIQPFVTKYYVDWELKINELSKQLEQKEILRKDLKSKIELDSSANDRYERLNQGLIKIKLENDDLKQELQRLEQLKNKTLPDSLQKRRHLFLEYLKTLPEEQQLMDSMYNPLGKYLKTINQEQLNFTTKFAFDVKSYSDKISSLINHSHKGPYADNEALETKCREFFNVCKDFLLKKEPDESLSRYLAEFEESFYKLNDNKIEAESYLKNKKNKLNLDEWIFSFDSFKVQYSIQYNGVDLQDLSPGIKGVILLLIFLTLNKDDHRPLLLDQPEENLDNRSIYTMLKDHFREAKTRRQIFLISHNANLVVNTDAEEIIVANFDLNLRSQATRIDYVSGPLENTKDKNPDEKNILQSQGIREHICDLLEGGTEAFWKREQKYALPAIVKFIQ